ncbi:MAG: hypothetical protein AMXMBFR13_10990 [Phycisphaerae bacterium]
MRWLPALLVLIASATPLSAVAQLQVGQRIPVQIQPPVLAASTSRPQLAAVCWSQVVSHPGATYIALHFSGFDLAPGSSLAISDPGGTHRYVLTGRGKMQAGSFWARHIKGDTVVLELTGGAEGIGPGFLIDEYAAGFVDLENVGPRAVCGDDDRLNAICFQDTHPEVYDASRAVVRLLIGGVGFCTGSLVSADHHVLTNNHCISKPADALNTDFDFMAETPNCDTPNCVLCWPGIILSGSTLVQSNTGLDYSLVRVSEGEPSDTFGHLEIDNRIPQLGEQIYHPQHSAAEAKEIAFFSSYPSDTGGVGRVQSLTEDTCLAASGIPEMGYYLDGVGGSSGSPIIAALTNKLIALHHCTGCPNRGVPAWMFYPEIERFVTGVEPLGGIAPGSASATSSGSAPGQVVEHSVDRNLSTGWASNSSSGVHWLQIDLGRLAAVSGFKVWHASSGGAATGLNSRVFEIQRGPTPAGPWTTDFIGENVTQSPSSGFGYARPQALRHIRLLITDAGADGRARVQELEVFADEDAFDALPAGSNVARQSVSVQASSRFNADLDGNKAIDGVFSLSSRWVSANTSPPHTLTLDLGAVRSLDGFVFRQASNVESRSYNANAISFQTGRSMSGPWYTEALVLTDGKGDWEARTLTSPKSARYIRLSLADPGPDSYARVPEFEVIAASGPRAGFSASPLVGGAPLTVHFTSLAPVQPNTWFWEFGDGLTSTEPDPSHVYALPGQYSVRLTINTPEGNHVRTRTSYIQVQGLVADFVGSPAHGVAPLEVQFTDRSSGQVQTWLWDFGDGGSSNLQNPPHTYQAPGAYSVSLTVSGPAGEDVKTRKTYIQVATVRPDFDLDGDVDQTDFGHLQACFSGAGLISTDPDCLNARLDEDQDVDQDDFTIFRGCMSGPGIGPEPDCAD